jgi:S-disulfanyl-L-cysteine oxidoreductase SoxD
MGLLRALPFVLLMGVSALAQSPNYPGVGRTPSAEEIRAWDISISPEGAELPPGRGTSKEGAAIYAQKCAVCHGKTLTEGPAPELKGKLDPKSETWSRGRIVPIRAPFATIVWDFINRGMPLGKEGSLTPDEVYSLTAYLLAINSVIPEDQVMDAQSLPKVKMPIGDNYASLPDWKPKTPRLKGYPY